MAAKRTTVFGTGRIYWAKIVGDRALHDNYDGDGREWSYELVPDDTSFLKEHKLLDRLKDKSDERNPDKGEFLYLRKPEFDREGNKNDPIRIYDEDDNDWPENKMLGNGTGVDFKLNIVDYGKGKKSGIYTAALRVTDLVPYESNEFGAMDAGKPSKAKKPPKQQAKAEPNGRSTDLDELDDDLPPFEKD